MKTVEQAARDWCARDAEFRAARAALLELSQRHLENSCSCRVGRNGCPYVGPLLSARQNAKRRLYNASVTLRRACERKN